MARVVSGFCVGFTVTVLAFAVACRTPRTTWEGTPGPLVCGSTDDQHVAQCVGFGRSWTCVDTAHYDTEWHCAPIVPTAAEGVR